MTRRKNTSLYDNSLIIENVESQGGEGIQDRDSFDMIYDGYMNIDSDNITPKQAKLRNRIFKEFVDIHPDVSTERLFKKAKGKDLRRDRLKTARKVVTTRKKYIKGGASKLDLKGYDTARQRVTKGIIQRRTFTVPARVRGKIVFALRTSVVVRGKSVVRHRDALGRFASAKVIKKPYLYTPEYREYREIPTKEKRIP